MTAGRRECLQLLLICSADATAWEGFVYLLMHSRLLTRSNPEQEPRQASSARPAELQHQHQVSPTFSGVSAAAPRPASPGGSGESSQCHPHRSSERRLSSPTPPRVKGKTLQLSSSPAGQHRPSFAAHHPENVSTQTEDQHMKSAGRREEKRR